MLFTRFQRKALSHTHARAREQSPRNMGSKAACAFTRNAAFWGNVTDHRVDPRDALTENNMHARRHAHTHADTGDPPPLRSRVPLDQTSDLPSKVIRRHAHRQPAELARFGCTRPQQHVRSGSDSTDMFTTTRASRTPMRQKRRARSKLAKKTSRARGGTRSHILYIHTEEKKGERTKKFPAPH